MAEGTRVLLVDDDPAMLRLLEVNFRIEGFVVDSATRGEEALAIAEATPPAAVLLDMMMPGMDGTEVCRRLRALPGFAEVPVIFLSARVRDEDEPDDPALGPVTHLSKPFDPQVLASLIRRKIAGGDAA